MKRHRVTRHCKSGKGVNRNEAYAIAMKQLGRKKSVLKKHQK